MIAPRSMTGYGRGESVSSILRVTVELRSVNHRFLDVKMKLPRAWFGLEAQLTERLRARLARGRVEAYVHREVEGEDGHYQVQVDIELARSVRDAVAGLASELDLSGQLSPADLVRMPGVLEVREARVDADAEVEEVEQAFDRALDGLEAMRRAEGERLARALSDHLKRVDGLVTGVEDLLRDQPLLLKARLQQRIDELLGSSGIDEARLAQEAAILADKANVDEELTRLRSHVEQAEGLLQLDEPVGRRLEFLVQELNREANTIASKSATTDVSSLAVEMKSEIEKIREQVANLE